MNQGPTSTRDAWRFGCVPRTCLACLGRIAMLASLLLTVRAWSQTQIACGSSAQRQTGGQGWLIRAEPGGDVIIWHLPPRNPGVTIGRARLAAPSRSMPLAAAAVADRLYLIYEERGPLPTPTPRQVLSLSAVPMDDAGRWATRPQGRFDVGPSLRRDGRVVAMGAGGGDVWVLMHGLSDDGADPSKLQLFRMRDNEWRPSTLPAQVQALGGLVGSSARSSGASLEWNLVDQGRGLALVVMDASGGRDPQIWTADTGGDEIQWRAMRVEGWNAGTPASQVGCVSAAGQLVAWTANASGEVSLFSAVSSRWRHVATVTGFSMPIAVAPLDADGMVAVLGQESETRRPAGTVRGVDRPPYITAEVSVRTGRLMYQGPIVSQSPVTPSDYRWMALLMFVVVTSVVVFVARPPGAEGEVHLPREVSLASGGQRAFATAADIAFGLVLAAGAWRVPLASLLTTEWWGMSESWGVGSTALVLLVCGGSLCEALMGRTIGKVVAGCAVVRVVSGDTEARTPNIAQALIRNVLKWTVPLVAIVGVLDVSRRHRGDEWARTAVVVQDPPEEAA